MGVQYMLRRNLRGTLFCALQTFSLTRGHSQTCPCLVKAPASTLGSMMMLSRGCWLCYWLRPQGAHPPAPASSSRPFGGPGLFGEPFFWADHTSSSGRGGFPSDGNGGTERFVPANVRQKLHGRDGKVDTSRSLNSHEGQANDKSDGDLLLLNAN